MPSRSSAAKRTRVRMGSGMLLDFSAGNDLNLGIDRVYPARMEKEGRSEEPSNINSDEY